MKSIKKLGLLFALAFTLVGLAPAVASAGEGTIEMNGNPACSITYTYGGSIPGSGALSGFESDGCEFVYPTLTFPVKIENLSSIGATFTGSPGSGSVTIDGLMTITMASGAVTCRYSLTTPPTGSYTSNYFSTTASGTATRIAGGFLCPINLTPINIEGTLP